MQKYLANYVTLSETQLYVAEVTGDGIVNVLDVTAINQYLSKIITSFPVEN